MPIFEYVCRECSHQFETIVLGSQKAECPKCESKRLNQKLSSFAVRGEKAHEAAMPANRAEAAAILLGRALAPWISGCDLRNCLKRRLAAYFYADFV